MAELVKEEIKVVKYTISLTQGEVNLIAEALGKVSGDYDLYKFFCDDMKGDK